MADSKIPTADEGGTIKKLAGIVTGAPGALMISVALGLLALGLVLSFVGPNFLMYGKILFAVVLVFYSIGYGVLKIIEKVRGGNAGGGGHAGGGNAH